MGQGDLGQMSDRCDGVPKLVRRIGYQLLFPAVGNVEAFEHPVQGAGQAGDLVVPVRCLQTSV